MKESDFQKELIAELKQRFPNCIVLKNDPTYKQGIPDLTILHQNGWCCLEVKTSIDANHQPNQDYWIKKLDDMSYAAFIYPDNKEVVLDEMEQLFLS